MKCNKRVIQRRITPEQLKKESENCHKWFNIKYTQIEMENPDARIVREYQKKENVQRLLSAKTTRDAIITVMEVVDDG